MAKYKLPHGYLSVSQVRQYLRCPQQYQFQYIEGLRSPTNPALIMGTAFHGALEKANRAKMNEGLVLSTDDVRDAYNDAWKADIAYRDGVDWQDKNPDQVKDRGIDMTAFYYEEEGSKHIPAYVEVDHRFNIETETAEIPFRSKMDLIEIDGMIRDYKTASRAPNADKADNDIQLPIYAMGFRDLTGEVEMGASLETVVGLKNEIKIVQLQTEVTDQRIKRTAETVEGVAKAISAGIFYPNDESFACSWCPFKAECKSYIGK